MASSREDEYEIQLYGFCTKDVSDSVAEMVDDEIRNQVETLTQSLAMKQSSEEGKSAVEMAGKACIDKYTTLSKGPMTNFSRQLPGFFSLPRHLLLSEDEVQRTQFTQEDEAQVRSEINSLKSRYRRAQYLKDYLAKEIEIGKQMDSQHKCLSKVLEVMEAHEVKNLNSKESVKRFHKVIQDILGLEVSDASLRLSNRPSCAECDETLIHAVLQSYNRQT